MQLFYTPNISNEKTYTLSESESKHAIRVLRLKLKDVVQLIDGKGNFYEAIIIDDNPKKCDVEITEITQEVITKPYLHIAIAPTKNNDRLEWFTEKCTEIGINEITPILCQHSERKNLKTDRLVKTSIAAMKQSLKASLPLVNELTNFKDLLATNFNGKKYIAHCYNQNQSHLKDLLIKGENALILIGPEGDFSEEEIAFSIKSGLTPISLGTSRLRTETAGILACTNFNLINE
jgi:16S rRNA (uracil1498-N3)-methyltransferase